MREKWTPIDFCEGRLVDQRDILGRARANRERVRDGVDDEMVLASVSPNALGFYQREASHSYRIVDLRKSKKKHAR